ncbi:MFS general substrate transporter [Rhodotorula diobovata]|uniref:MFS general substrate transporter n=1 Tax=Rhodotorula diobovata TaxID=5288 RepID=A0A5C5FU10_9BASI|nr:MFS general substrate transporter [Rhodotorula diobovata]
MPSNATASTEDKKLEDGHGHVVAAGSESPLSAIVESDGEGDEGAELAGDVPLEYTEEEVKAVRRKVYTRIVPLLAGVYFSQFLDKNSINYSSVMGLPLASKGVEYNLVTAAFYIGFVLSEVPQSILAQRFPMAKYLGVNICLWAGALLLHSATALFAPFFVFRVALGVFESVVSPILIATVASWFKKSEQARVVGAWYAMNGVTLIVGGALAYGITTAYEGPADHWRVIYWVLGSMALAVGAAILIWLPDSPASAKFLNERERQIALERVRGNQSGTVSRRFKKAQALEAVRDPKLITTVSVAYWADKRNARMLPFVGAVIPSIIGFILLLAFSASGNNKEHKAPLLVGIILSQTFVSSISLLYSWSASNIAGSSKRSVVNGMMLCAFGLGNICGSQAFQASTAPRYYPGKIALFCLLVALVPLALGMRWYTKRLNAKKAEQVRALVEANGWTLEDLQRERDAAAFKDLTDSANPFYVYVC